MFTFLCTRLSTVWCKFDVKMYFLQFIKQKPHGLFRTFTCPSGWAGCPGGSSTVQKKTCFFPLLPSFPTLSFWLSCIFHLSTKSLLKHRLTYSMPLLCRFCRHFDIIIKSLKWLLLCQIIFQNLHWELNQNGYRSSVLLQNINARSANRELEVIIKKHNTEFEKEHCKIELE